MKDSASSRVRMQLAGISGPWEVAVVTAVTIGVWRLALGWDWSSVPSADPLRSVAPQSGIDWLALGLAVAAGVGWLAWRDLAVAGTASIWLAMIVLSGWRLAVAGILGWPIDLAALIFIVSAVCIVAASVGTWLRHHAGRHDDDRDDDDYQGLHDHRDFDSDDLVPHRGERSADVFPVESVARPSVTTRATPAAVGSPRL